MTLKMTLRKRKQITVTIDAKLMNYVDKLVKQNEYRSRSHAFEEGLKLLREKEESFLEKLREGKL